MTFAQEKNRKALEAILDYGDKLSAARADIGHEDFDINTYEYIKEKRDIFKCPKHKDGADYSDYLVKDRPTKQEKLAPVNALPKHSKGDNPKYRFKLETARGKVSPIKTTK